MADTMIRDDEYDDLRLVTEYLNHQLDPERVKVVRQRLEDDPAFREFAAPLLLAWSVPPTWQSNPVPRGEIEKHWDEFTKMAGFVHQRRKVRRRWITSIGVLVLALAVAGFTLRGRTRAWYVDRRDYMDVQPTADWITLANGAQVKLAPGTRLRVQKESYGGSVKLKLRAGTVDVQAAPAIETGELMPKMQPVLVETRGCLLTTVRAEFSATVRGDTTDVIVNKPTHPFWAGFLIMPTEVALGRSTSTYTEVKVREGLRGRCVRGQKATREGRP